MTVDDDPGQQLMRETGRFLFFFAGELEVCHDVTQTTEKQILVAGIGNAWLRDDGFGGEVVKRLRGPRAALRRERRATSAPAASTSPTRSCAATTRWSSSTSAARAASRARST